MNPPSIREHLLWRCGLGVGLLMCLLSVAVYLLVQRSLFSELDDSIAQTAALLANQVELEDESIIFEWGEGLGTNHDLSGLFGLLKGIGQRRADVAASNHRNGLGG